MTLSHFRLRSSEGDYFLASFTSSSLKQGDGSSIEMDQIQLGATKAFQELVSRRAKTVSNSTPVRPSRSSSGSGGSGGGDGSSGGGAEKLKIATSLKGIGVERLLELPSPDIRRTAAARLEESPRDARWFTGVEVESAPKKRVANRLWRAAKGRWDDALGGAHSQEEDGEEAEEAARAAAARSRARAPAHPHPRLRPQLREMRQPPL